MGFFSDLKDDLSQAVNELMPPEGEEAMKAAEENAESADTAAGMPSDMDLNDFGNDFIADFGADLSQMLDKVEEVELPEEKPAPAVERKVPDAPMQLSRQVSDEVSVLTESMIINGNIATEGALDVRGRIVGNVEALGKLNITGEIQGNSQGAEIYTEGARITGELRSQGSIKVGQNAVILGNIFATSAVVAGAVRGDLDVRGPVILDSSAIVMGDIKSKSVQINNGAVVEGMCSQCYAEVNPTSFFEELKKMK